jgi:hypothetical protein
VILIERLSDSKRKITFVRAHQFTCGEIDGLLAQLDLSTFDTLPKVTLVSYRQWGTGVDLILWKGVDCELPSCPPFQDPYEWDWEKLIPDLIVTNLHLITGSGSFTGSDICCGGECAGGDDGDNCDDERIIVGVAELTKMVQSYGDSTMSYRHIWITKILGRTSVKYQLLLNTRLTVDLDDLLGQGIFQEKVAGVDVLTALGSGDVWGSPPHFQKVNLSGNLSSGEPLLVKYIQDSAVKLTLKFNNEVVSNSLDEELFGESLEAFGSSDLWSTPHFDAVDFSGDPSANEDFVVEYKQNGETKLTLTYANEVVNNTLDEELFGESLEAFGSSDLWSAPHFDAVDFSGDPSAGEDFKAEYKQNGETKLILTYANEVVNNTLDEELFGESLEAFGSSDLWSAPHFDAVDLSGDPGAGEDLLVKYKQVGETKLTLTFDNPVVSNSILADYFGAVLEAFGSSDLWSTPCFYAVDLSGDPEEQDFTATYRYPGDPEDITMFVTWLKELMTEISDENFGATFRALGESEICPLVKDNIQTVLLEPGEAGFIDVTITKRDGTEVTGSLDPENFPQEFGDLIDQATGGARVVSSDSAGTEEKDIFYPEESVYCYAENLPDPDNDQKVRIYVVNDDDWAVGSPIEDVSGGFDEVKTNEGRIVDQPVLIWPAPLTPGKYDIIIDVDNYGELDANEPVDGMEATAGFEAIPEFTTIAIPVGLILLLFFFNERKRRNV